MEKEGLGDEISVGIQISEGGEDRWQMIATLGFHLRFPSLSPSLLLEAEEKRTEGSISLERNTEKHCLYPFLFPLPL
jgi:hypothetical protein